MEPLEPVAMVQMALVLRYIILMVIFVLGFPVYLLAPFGCFTDCIIIHIAYGAKMW